jgi:hypothetical protein
MHLPSSPSSSGFTLPAPPVTLLAVAAASLGALLLLQHASAVTTLTTLTTRPADVSSLPYPPDALPGARDVVSPYGSLRVYEWGPEHGDRILLIHGISTPSIALADLAHRLVAKGCRVMLFGTFLTHVTVNPWFVYSHTVHRCLSRTSLCSTTLPSSNASIILHPIPL